jgi:Uma2 family endonuclease
VYATNAFLSIPVVPPCTLALDPPMGDDEFETLSEQCEFAIVERACDGRLIVSELSGANTSSASGEIGFQFSTWCKNHDRGHALAHCGYFLPDGSCLSPDSSYVTNERIERLTRVEREHFLRLAPDFVIELRAQSEGLTDLARKMESWIANGVQLGWLVDPYGRQVHIYAPSGAPRIEAGSAVAGSGPVEGFVLDLEEVWSCYE